MSLFLVWFWLQRLHFSPCYQGFHDTRYVLIILFGESYSIIFFLFIVRSSLISLPVNITMYTEGSNKPLWSDRRILVCWWSLGVFFFVLLDIFSLMLFWYWNSLLDVRCSPYIQVTHILHGWKYSCTLKVVVIFIHCLGFMLRLKLCLGASTLLASIWVWKQNGRIGSFVSEIKCQLVDVMWSYEHSRLTD